MMTRSLRTILISAYLSAMLTSSIIHVRGNVVLAGAIDSTVARQVLQSAVAGLSSEGWATSATIPATVAMPTTVMSGIPAPQAANPVISEELMARLIKRTLANEKDTWIIAPLCRIFGMCDGTANMPVKQITATQPDGKHHIEVPLKEGSKDIVVTFNNGSVLEHYLTDKSGNLRAAATSSLDGSGLRLLTNEQAAEKFKAEMRILAKLAEKLPPTGTAVAGNS